MNAYSYDRTAYNEISIGALERAVRSFARQLESKGFQTEVDAFQTGRGGAQHYGPSYVTLTITKNFVNADGEEDEFWDEFRFIAGGYPTGLGRKDIGGNEGWRPMKAEAVRRLTDSLQSSGLKL